MMTKNIKEQFCVISLTQNIKESRKKSFFFILQIAQFCVGIFRLLPLYQYSKRYKKGLCGMMTQHQIYDSMAK